MPKVISIDPINLNLHFKIYNAFQNSKPNMYVPTSKKKKKKKHICTYTYSTHKSECYHLPAATIYLLIVVLPKKKKKTIANCYEKL